MLIGKSCIKGDALPTGLRRHENVAIVTMSEKRFGCIGVCDAQGLAGVITDGDLRRNMSATLLEQACQRHYDPFAQNR